MAGQIVQLRHDGGVRGAAWQEVAAHELVAFAASAFNLARKQPRPVQHALLLPDGRAHVERLLRQFLGGTSDGTNHKIQRHQVGRRQYAQPQADQRARIAAEA